ncbi:bifunctional 2-polyprenyl-6-hydroxyphenol methylase/3-demethylubiquinol 3-O-methyltransferase UbiG [Hydrogenovibrio kuenenii]|uniref:bifunctional 2-polyprenyl-6-hydroxyphenol methylase/3-demethylubiquinol 3-O-methyltransferase UbiG n=1 Tax=Hydrogenovibrio kuenenii TaxID=63658 RepID=UPI0004678C4C|nr:bifunctional 2-polyprenyl-6-hydroxyphenol methylase/3-demethylubiquinol 3-O-methyltransferase UbiG [Hydrogenovibrio kuenenii]
MSAHSNADLSELNNFNQFAHTWWDESGEFGALHTINPFRLEFIKTFISLKGTQALDIGCGGGILSESLAKAGAQTTGIDLAEEVLTIAKLHSLESELSINYQCISAESHAKEFAGHYDVVTCMEMLEHVPDPASIIQAAADCVKPGGWVFFSTLNRNYKAYLLGIFAAENIMNLVPKGTHTYDKFIKPAELDQMARQAGLHLVEGAGIDFNPVLNQYGLSDKLDVNYLLAYQKL